MWYRCDVSEGHDSSVLKIFLNKY